MTSVEASLFSSRILCVQHSLTNAGFAALALCNISPGFNEQGHADFFKQASLMFLLCQRFLVCQNTCFHNPLMKWASFFPLTVLATTHSASQLKKVIKIFLQCFIEFGSSEQSDVIHLPIIHNALHKAVNN